MYTMGIDIGSSASKVVVLEDGKNIIANVIIPVGTGTTGPRRAFEQALNEANLNRENIEKIVATGYGRNNYKDADDQISEISCHAKGVHFLNPNVRTIIDIGGQDAKAIKLDTNGNVMNFVMNEKCAAGTGRFLEVMSRVLESDVSKLANLEEEATEILPISSTCTVFAESEVISQLSAGKPRADVVAGIHESIARRVAGLVNRVGLTPEIVMTGGVAQNSAVVKAMERALKINIKTAPNPQITGALGAAILGFEKSKPVNKN